MEHITDEKFAQLMADSGLSAALKRAESEGYTKELIDKSVAEWREKLTGDGASDFERQLAARDWSDQPPAALAAVAFPVLEDYCINTGSIPEMHRNTAEAILPYVTPEFHALLTKTLEAKNEL